ncbi:MAG TPA: pilus assembly protein TadG-related protein, partial [Solirubrobacterales bacterium]|nr:pilus assembly protein TadG-related protein [Solirubrobacterales bacterium]
MRDEIRGTDVRKTGRESGSDERGVTMVMVAVALTALLGASALAIDVGALWVARTQLQNGADAAALG